MFQSHPEKDPRKNIAAKHATSIRSKLIAITLRNDMITQLERVIDHDIVSDAFLLGASSVNSSLNRVVCVSARSGYNRLSD